MSHVKGAPGAVTISGAQTITGAKTFSSAITASGGQIVFPATQVASAGANTLDDYEEGVWTPDIAFGGAAEGVTYTQRAGAYTKIGRMVALFGQIYLSSKGTSVGSATITGVPFTANVNNNYPCSLYILQNITYANFPQAKVDSGATTITLAEVTEAGTRTDLTDADFADTSRLEFTAVFWV